MMPDCTSRPLASLVTCQLFAELAIGLPFFALGGFCAAWVPPLGAVAAAFAWFLVRGRRRGLARAQVRALAVGSGLAHAAIAAAAYAAMVLAWPGAFAFPPSAVFLIAPLLGGAAGLVLAALTLVAGDGAASALGGFAEGETSVRIPPRR